MNKNNKINENNKINKSVNKTANSSPSNIASASDDGIKDGSYSINRQYKDSLFRLVFNNKFDLLNLYNTLNNTTYTDTEQLNICTIDDVIYMGYKNDISFVLGNILSLYEHQSSLNPNMPVRGLIYFARNYESYIASNNLNIYGTVLQKLPLPQYIIFYNGTDYTSEQLTLKLSDAFPEIEGKLPCLECTATMLNINYGHNKHLLDSCEKLGEYSLFIHTVREKKNIYSDNKDAIDAAIDECIKNHILEDILVKQRAEVRNVILTQFDQEAYEKALRAEAEELGMKRGMEQGIERGIAIGQERGIAIGENNYKITVIQKNYSRGLPPAQIADILCVTVEFVEQVIEELLNR